MIQVSGGFHTRWVTDLTLSNKSVFQMIGERVSWCLCKKGNVTHMCVIHTGLQSYWNSQ